MDGNSHLQAIGFFNLHGYLMKLVTFRHFRDANFQKFEKAKLSWFDWFACVNDFGVMGSIIDSLRDSTYCSKQV